MVQKDKAVKIINWSPLGCGLFSKETPHFPTEMLPRLRELELDIETLYSSWELIRFAGDEYNTDTEESIRKQKALIIIILALRLSVYEGSTRLSLEDDVIQRVKDDFTLSEDDFILVREMFKEIRQGFKDEDGQVCLTPLFGVPGDYRPLIIDDNCLYMQKLHILENRVAVKLSERLSMPATIIPGIRDDGELNDKAESILAEVLSKQPVAEAVNPDETVSFDGSGSKALKIELNDEQIRAVRTILKSPISIISGKPGSGKTSIVATVLRVIARLGEPHLESIALAAPTGKAADRMRRSITDHLNSIPDREEPDQRLLQECPPSTTIHRLLGYSPRQDRYLHNEDNPLAEQLVIVDEASMADLSMMDRILRALRPNARLVLLGDANQLPSVDTGAVLRDLCESEVTRKSGRAVVLEKSYRAREENKSGKAILEVAAAINKGSLPKDLIPRIGISEPEDLIPRVGMIEPGEQAEQSINIIQPVEHCTNNGRPDQTNKNNNPDKGSQKEKLREEASHSCSHPRFSFVGVELFTPSALTSEKTGHNAPSPSSKNSVSNTEDSALYNPIDSTVETFYNCWLQRMCLTLPDFYTYLQYQYSSGPEGFDSESAVKLAAIMKHYEKYRILCVTRVTVGGTGSETINEWFRRAWKNRMQEIGIYGYGERARSQFTVGEPVIITGNDYRLRLFNGDSGLILPVKPHDPINNRETIPMAVFSRGESFVAYPPDLLRGRLEPAWATTVHKAQGSEYDHVAIILPGIKARPLTRELLYTAVTRAKESVTIVGSEEILKHGINKKATRNSGLPQKL